jgi:hypothetical protein
LTRWAIVFWPAHLAMYCSGVVASLVSVTNTPCSANQIGPRLEAGQRDRERVVVQDEPDVPIIAAVAKGRGHVRDIERKRDLSCAVPANRLPIQSAAALGM